MENYHLNKEFGEESVFLLRQWEKIEKKMVDFRNHIRFSLRCLKRDVIPVSIRLKTNIKTIRGLEIIRKTERKLLNEHIRSINNSLELYMYERGSIVQQLEERLGHSNLLEECQDFINRVIECRHQRVMTRQKRKFELLCQQKTGGHSNKEDYVDGAQTSDTNSSYSKWVINLSDTPLTKAQTRLLAHGPKFAIIPRHPPKEEYVASIEYACQKLNEGKAEELRVEIKNILKKNHPNKSNITKEEFRAIKELKQDEERIILTADKGVALVVLNKKDYIEKAEHLLSQLTYRKIQENPTSKQKAKLIRILKKIKTEGGISKEKYKKMYPMGAGSPKFYGLPKIHKKETPLRPIVSSTGTVSYNAAKELANILKPLVGWTPHHLKNTKDFIEQIKDVKLLPDETIISYDIKALFTSVPIQPVINIIKSKLENDKDLKLRTSMSIHHITSLLEYCLKGTYFVFRGQYYEQLEGAAMGSPLSPIIANLYMEEFEAKALNTAPNPPTLWKRFVDDTFVVIKKCHQEEFFHHIDSIEDSIQFTAEDTKADGTLPFLDVLIIPQPDGSITTAVYRKPTNTNQYLQWDSHHEISAKYSVISTLFHRAKEVCSTKQQLEDEQDHIKQALSACKYPKWAMNRVEKKRRVQRQSRNKNQGLRGNTNPTKRRTQITVPYIKGLGENVKNICKRYGVQVFFKGGKTIKDLLMAPKDRDLITQKVASFTGTSVIGWSVRMSI